MGMGSGSGLQAIAAGLGVVPASSLVHQPLPAGPELEHLLPEGLPGGTSVEVSSAALTLLLMAAATKKGSWVATVGYPELGWLAASEQGALFDHCVSVPSVGKQAAKVIASLIDGVDLVVLRQVGALDSSDARRLLARARERHCTLLLDRANWPLGASMTISVAASHWEGARQGDGHLRGRWADVRVTGHGALSKGRNAWLWLGAIPSHNKAPTIVRAEEQVVKRQAS